MITQEEFDRRLAVSVAAGKITQEMADQESEKRQLWIASQTQTVAPSLLQKAKNFATSAAKHIAAGMPMCTAEQVAARFAICQGCEFYKDGACLKCGCPLVREKKFISKLSWAHEVCPVGKWGKVDTGS